MSDPISFESASPRFALPLLFAGQAQKEAFVNEALSLVDGLLHCAVEGEAAGSPSSPIDGTAWLITASAGGVWAGREGQLALRQAGQWLFVEPREGMRIMNKATGQDLRVAGGSWAGATAPAPATGGSVVDAEARAMLAGLIAALRQTGVFSA